MSTFLPDLTMFPKETEIKLLTKQMELLEGYNDKYTERLYDAMETRITELTKDEGECEECNGAGEVVNRARIHSRSIDIPYMNCPSCYGSGVTS